MSKHIIRIIVAFLTFLIGSIATVFYERIIHSLSIRVRTSASFSNLEINSRVVLNPVVKHNKVLPLEFLKYTISDDRLFAEFRFTNIDSEPVYYTAYSKGVTPNLLENG